MTPNSLARLGRAVAWPLTALCVAMGAATVVLSIANHTSLLDHFTPGALSFGVLFPVLGALIVSRRGSTSIGWIFIVLGLSQVASVYISQYATWVLVGHHAAPLAGFSAWVGTWVFAPGLGLFLSFALLLFPTGRLPSRRWTIVGVIAIVGLAVVIVPMAIAAWPMRGRVLLTDDLSSVPGLRTAGTIQQAGLQLLLISGVLSVASLVIRFRRANAEERQQIKWFAFAGAFVAVGLSASIPLNGEGVSRFMILVVAPLPPAAAALAIFKYGLYEIDRIISRTISYGIVTALLGGAFVTFALAPTLFVRGKNPTWVVAGATLVVAALFRPLRRRVQDVVDHRFNRRRYDAERIIEAFALRLREQIDIDVLGAELQTVVARAMQPTTSSLWLRQG